jgi:hypothetical protein
LLLAVRKKKLLLPSLHQQQQPHQLWKHLHLLLLQPLHLLLPSQPSSNQLPARKKPPSGGFFYVCKQTACRQAWLFDVVGNDLDDSLCTG